jgi:hypothetical protein
VKVEDPLQIGLARFLPPKIMKTVCTADERIGFRIPDFIFSPVKNTNQVLRPLPEDPIKPKPLLGRLDLLSICRAHCSNPISEDKTSFEKVDFTPKLQIAGGEEMPLEVQDMPIQITKKALVPQVVNCKNGLHRGKLRIKMRLSFKECDGKC